jgi:surface protein
LSDHKSHTFCSFFVVCGLKRDLVVVVCAVGLDFLFFVAPFSLLAVFWDAVAFNQDVSKWNTGAVTTMAYSKCTLSSSLLATAPSVVVCC